MAFSTEAIRWQLELAAGWPANRTVYAGVAANSPTLIAWPETYQSAGYAGLVVFIRKGLTQEQIDAAPYGAGAVANVTAGGPGGNLPAGLPHQTPLDRADMATCRSQLINYVSLLGVEKQLLVAEIFCDSMFAGKPALPFGTGGYTTSH